MLMATRDYKRLLKVKTHWVREHHGDQWQLRPNTKCHTELVFVPSLTPRLEVRRNGTKPTPYSQTLELIIELWGLVMEP